MHRGGFPYYPGGGAHMNVYEGLGVLLLKTNIEARACDMAIYLIENKATVRAAAKRFGISKSTVHTEVIN